MTTTGPSPRPAVPPVVPKDSLLVLGIETSCDETAAAVVARDAQGRGRILSNVVRSQFDMHKIYGGVVPEIAARAHGDCLDHIISAAMAEAGVGYSDLDAVAAASGPGLIGGLIVGAVSGKALALAAGKPFLAINHLEAHALTAGLTDGIKPPYLMLLVSGGHTQLLLVEGVGRYRRLGTTIDDALGEAFDKTAKLLGLGFPGGPAVEAAAKAGDPRAVPLPRPLMGSAEPHFSFAGLKSAVRRAQESGQHAPADIAASFQQAVIDCLLDRTERALEIAPEAKSLVVAGGVAANRSIRAALEGLALHVGLRFVAPPPWLCTDNAAMIAWAGAERFGSGHFDPLDFEARPRWPLDTEAERVRGAGVKA